MSRSYTPSRERIQRFLESLDVQGRTLDIGCGGGPYRTLFRDRIGVDVRLEAGVDVCGSVYELPFESESFDVVLATEVLEHLAEPARAIGEMRRVLKPGGCCVLTTRFCYPIHYVPDDYYRFSGFSLRRLFADWRVVRLEPDTDMISTLAEIFGFSAREPDDIATRLFRRLCWPVLWRVFTLTRRRTSPSALAPSGYHVLAVKPDGPGGLDA